MLLREMVDEAAATVRRTRLVARERAEGRTWEESKAFGWSRFGDEEDLLTPQQDDEYGPRFERTADYPENI